MAKDEMNAKHVGLTLGLFAAFIHAVWALGVAAGVMQGFLDYIFPLHFLSRIYTVVAFSWANAAMLIVLAFVGGYVMGWVYAKLSNWTARWAR